MNLRRCSALLATTMLLIACSDNSGGTGSATTAVGSETTAAVTTVAVTTVAPLSEATFTLIPGTEQLAIVQADPDITLSARNLQGDVVATGTVDAQGSLLFRGLAAGDYVVESSTERSPAVNVAPAAPAAPTTPPALPAPDPSKKGG